MADQEVGELLQIQDNLGLLEGNKINIGSETRSLLENNPGEDQYWKVV